MSFLFIISFQTYNLKTKTTINAKFSDHGIFFETFICCYIIWLVLPRKVVHKIKLFKSNIKHHSSFFHHFPQSCNIKLLIWVRLDMFSDFQKQCFFFCSCFSSTWRFSLDYLYQSENLNYTVHGTLCLQHKSSSQKPGVI